ncbi:MAG: hypothetical protein ABL886_05680 [Rhodoglobus sp.]
MARIRTIKPEFFSSERIARLSHPAKVTFLGLLTESDDYGVATGNVRLLKGHIWPLEDDISAADIETHLAELAEEPALIASFHAEGRRFIHILGFQEHQSINKPSSRRNPEPPQPPDQDIQAATGGVRGPSGSPTGARMEGYPGEVEVEVEVEHVFSSSGPTQEELSTGAGEDDESIDLTDPEPPANLNDAPAKAKAVAIALGARDSARAPNVRDEIPHSRSCAEFRWALQGPEIIALANANPRMRVTELADRLEAIDAAQALHPATVGARCGICGDDAHPGGAVDCPEMGDQ